MRTRPGAGTRAWGTGPPSRAPELAQIHHYSHATTPAGAGSDTVISAAVEIDPAFRLGAAAAVGDVSIVGIQVDDPNGDYNFAGLWRWYVIEDECDSGDHYAFNGY